MAHGSNDEDAGHARTQTRRTLTVQQVFTQESSGGGVHPGMNVHGLEFRESRDSEAHPDSLDLAFIADLTGSMGEVRRALAFEILPPMMAALIDVVPDIQVLFGGFGDYDTGDGVRSLQIGQYEADGALADQWLTREVMCGGSTPSESAELAFYFGAYLTRTDAWEKRGRKGYLFVTTDDTMRVTTRAVMVHALLGRKALENDIPTTDLVREAQQLKYCFVLVQPHRTYYGGSYSPQGWEEPYAFGDVVGCYEYYLGAPFVIVPPRAVDTAAVTVILVGLTEGIYRTPDDVRSSLSGRHFRLESLQVEATVRAVARYGNHLYPENWGEFVQ